jgi:hypothetical protein
VLLNGEQRWTFEFGDLVESIKKKCQIEPANMPLDSLSLSIWLDVPNPIWNKYSRDFQFYNEMKFQIENHMLLMIKEWALMRDSAETQILGARGKKEIRQKIISEFTKNSDHARLQWEDACKDLLIGIIRAKAKSDGDYARYKVKCGVKFVSTVGGIAVSFAGLATSATPAAPATLVPAVIGLVASVYSCAKQFLDLTLDAADVLFLIKTQLGDVELKWKEPGPNGEWNVKTMRAIEFKNAVFASMLGDLTEFACPTIAGLKDKNTLMLKKTDGLEQKLHEFVMSIVKLEDGLRELARNNSEFQKQERLIQDMRDEIPQKENEIRSLRLAGDKFGKVLDEAEAALGTNNIKLIVGLLYSLGTLGAGYASPPTELSGKVTSALGTIQGALDLARENYATVNDDWRKK